MPKLKTTGGNVILKDGKPSCGCCSPPLNCYGCCVDRATIQIEWSFTATFQGRSGSGGSSGPCSNLELCIFVGADENINFLASDSDQYIAVRTEIARRSSESGCVWVFSFAWWEYGVTFYYLNGITYAELVLESPLSVVAESCTPPIGTRTVSGNIVENIWQEVWYYDEETNTDYFVREDLISSTVLGAYSGTITIS